MRWNVPILMRVVYMSLWWLTAMLVWNCCNGEDHTLPQSEQIQNEIESIEKEDENSVWDTLFDWHRKRGELSEKVEIRNGPYGRGVFAKQKVLKGELLYRIEPEAIITAEWAIEKLHNKIPVGDVKLDCIDVLNLLLVLEGRNGKESGLRPYINSLPNDHKTMLVNWPDRYDDLLMEHVILTKASRKRVNKLRYARIEQTYNQLNRMNWIREEEFQSAYMTVKSRGIGWWYPAAENRPDWFRFTEDCSAMAPVFDMWNHHAKDNCAWIAPGYPRALEVIAMEDVKVDQELFIGYGKNLSNKKSVEAYGFTTSGSRILEKIEFTDFELLHACQNVLSYSEEYCMTRQVVAHKSVKPNRLDLEALDQVTGHFTPDYVDFDCSTNSVIIRQIVQNSNVHRSKEQDDDREKDIILWILRKRLMRIKELERALTEHVFATDQLIFKTMISDLHRSEKNTLITCIPKFQRGTGSL